MCEIPLLIAEYQLPIAGCSQIRSTKQIRRQQLAIKNNLETPNRGQGAKCPDRFLAKMRLLLTIKFFGSNASASILPNLSH
jgi:hypothetical protein